MVHKNAPYKEQDCHWPTFGKKDELILIALLHAFSA